MFLGGLSAEGRARSPSINPREQDEHVAKTGSALEGRVGRRDGPSQILYQRARL